MYINKVRFSGLVFLVYLFLIVIFTAIYKGIYENDKSSFLISNSDLIPKIVAENRKAVEETLSDLKKIQNEAELSTSKLMLQKRMYITFLDKGTALSQDNKFALLIPELRGDRYYYARILLNKVRYTNGYLTFDFHISGQGYRELLEGNYSGMAIYFSCRKQRADSLLLFATLQMQPFNNYDNLKGILSRSIKAIKYNTDFQLMNLNAEMKERKNQIAVLTQQLTGSQTQLNYWDFLYFSTITQTSTGYGDILPNSRIVRMLVAFQIIVGLVLFVIVIGLYDEIKPTSISTKNDLEAKPK